jgi:tRNA(fMet)-specific endonuclease VapC
VTPRGHEHGVLDTSTVISLGRVADVTGLPRVPIITAVTLAELSVGPLIADDDDERARRQAHLQEAEADFDVLPFDVEAARAFARVAAGLRRSGRKRTARSFDALIAATALSQGLPLYTSNPADFEGVEDLEIVPVALV